MAKWTNIVEKKLAIKRENEDKAIRAIDALVSSGEKVTVGKVAAKINVAPSTIYRNETLIGLINQVSENPRIYTSADSLTTLLKLEERKNKKLENNNKSLERQLALSDNYKLKYDELLEKYKTALSKIEELEQELADERGRSWM